MILKDKVIIVTGGSGLLGKSIVNDIKKEGGIAINIDINNETIPSNHLYKLDLTETEFAIKFKNILKNYSKIDGLVNNAYPRTNDWGNRFEDLDLNSFKLNVDWQMNSVFNIIKEVISKMDDQEGSIVNIASIYGVVGNDFSIYEGTDMTSPVAYSAIKGGVISMTRYLASYFGPKKIRFNCVSPGGILNGQNEIFVNNYNKKVPLGRMGKPDDISPTVSFLLSNKSKYITGQNIIIDGGWTII